MNERKVLPSSIFCNAGKHSLPQKADTGVSRVLHVTDVEGLKYPYILLVTAYHAHFEPKKTNQPAIKQTKKPKAVYPESTAQDYIYQLK